jgi:hemerythrin
MDSAHRGQAQLVDALEDAVNHGDAHAAEDLLLRLVEETSDHFEAEHEVMQVSAFPGREAHIEEHNRLLQDVSALLGSVSAGQIHLTIGSVQSLRRWFVRHVQGHDRVLGEHLRSTGGT